MKIIKHETFSDNRGSYTPIRLDILGLVWDQCSISINEKKYTFRGLHYQTDPKQIKYVKVIHGKIVDFSYDLITNNLEWATLTKDDAVLIEETKAHGFLTLEDNTVVSYLTKGEYNPESEHSIVWQTIPLLKEFILEYIGENNLIISKKDQNGK